MTSGQETERVYSYNPGAGTGRGHWSPIPLGEGHGWLLETSPSLVLPCQIRSFYIKWYERSTRRMAHSQCPTFLHHSGSLASTWI